MEPLVSIIVPVHNAEKYLECCIESILRQEYQDFELLLIDDGSTDRSGDIMDAYARQDFRIHVIHQKNMGVSYSRNKGLDIARGTYIQFVDSDDQITEDATKLLAKTAQEASCDMVIADFYRVVGNRYSQKGNIGIQKVMNQLEFTSYMVKNPADFYYGVLWNKLFKRSIIEKHHMRMDTEYNWCEDFLFNLEYIRYAETFCAIQTPIYYYFKRKGSLVSQNLTISNTIKMKKNVFDYYNALYKDIYEDNYKQIKFKVHCFLISSAKDGMVKKSRKEAFKYVS